MLTYPINEVFESIQGEAQYTGTPSIFIRLQGCPVACPWCDTKHTWEVDEKNIIAKTQMKAKITDSDKFSRMTAAEILELVKTYRARHVVITGGEPALYDLRPLVEALTADDFCAVQIETSGTHEVLAPDNAWVTVSPKIGMAKPLLLSAIRRADEIKHPVGKMMDIERLQEVVLPWKPIGCSVWLQPLSQNEKATRLCVEEATKNGWRVSVQTHKFLGVR